MKYLSLFSGIGGFEYGIQNACNQQLTEVKQDGQGGNGGINEVGYDVLPTGGIAPLCIGYSEIDKYAIQVYEKHFKHKNYGDATKINPRELPDFDLLVGGFPCQAFSIAGKRKGFDDTRGTLFFDIARILAEKKPRLVVLENVKGLLSHNGGKTFETILRVLTDLGYFVEWQVLNSKNFGVPQNRERVFIVGYLGGQPRRKVFPINGTNSKDIIVNGVLDTETWRKRHEQIRRTHDVNGISPTLPTGTGGGVMTKIKQDMAVRRLTPTECERLQGFPEVEKRSIMKVCIDHQNKIVSVGIKSLKSQQPAGNVEKTESNETARSAEKGSSTKHQQTSRPAQSDVLISCEENGVEIHSRKKLLLNAKGAEKKNWSHPLMQIDDFVQLLVGINTTQENAIKRGEEASHQNEQCLIRHKNGTTLVKLFGKEMMQPVRDVESDSATLKELLKFTTSDHLNIKSSEQKLATLYSFVIRAITGFIPTEIQNQSTFTIELNTKMGWSYGLSDTQRYKCLGNAVTTNVITYIFQKLLTTK